MAVNEYIDQFAEFSDRFARLGLKGFKLYEQTLGTDVTVTRIKNSGDDPSSTDDRRYNKLLKSAMNISESNEKNHTQTFQARLLINKSQMGPMTGKTTEEISVTYTANRFCPGDLITFRYRGYNYRFKVMPGIEAFGLQDDILYRMTLQPYRETK